MQTIFRSVRELDPGPAWQGLFAQSWESYHEWFLKEGEAQRPGYITCRAALSLHLPELVPTWDNLVHLAGGGDHAARFLSLYRPAPYLSGCSQAVWSKGARPLLIRNYDYHPRLFEGTILMSAWNGVKTIVQSDCMWGALDGMNEFGVAASLAFGGRSAVGEGFGIPLVMRYVLGTCHNCAEAKAVLARVPTHMSYNVSVVDAAGTWFTAYLAPDRPPRFDDCPVATNHQGEVEWTKYAKAVSTEERWRVLRDFVADPSGTEQGLIGTFLQEPIFSGSYERGFGTLYTAIYNPREGIVDYVWKDHTVRHSFDNFQEGTVSVSYDQPVSV